ncbi:unnamed protein product [Choristocarpus tenellus]
MVAQEWILLVASAITLLLLRVWFVLPYRRRRRGSWDPILAGRDEDRETISTMIVLGSGGHTSEMLKLTAHLSPSVYAPVHYVVARTDHTSADRIPSNHLTSNRCKVVTIPRSREVGQPWLSSFLTTLWAALHSALLVVKVRPDLVLVNGPGTCVPICLVAFILRVFGDQRGRIVFCESFCRVRSLSLTGKIMYRLADRFVVHWPELLGAYPHAEYIGQLL